VAQAAAEAELATGLQLICRDASALPGGADPSEEGVARGH